MRFSAPSSQSRLLHGIAFFDLCWLVVSPFIALWLREPSFLEDLPTSLHLTPAYQYALATILGAVPCFIFFKINQGISFLFSARDVIRICVTCLSSMLVSTYFVFSFSRLNDIPRSVPVIYGLILFVGLSAYRIIVRTVYEKKQLKEREFSKSNGSINYRKIIMVGMDQFAISAIRLVDYQKPRTVHVVAAVSHNRHNSGKTISGVKIVGSLLDLGSLIDEYFCHGVRIDEIWLSDNSYAKDETALTYVKELSRSRDISCALISDVLNLRPQVQSNLELINDARDGVENIEKLKVSRPYYKLKRIIDVLAGMCMTLLLTPVFLVVTLIVLLDDGPPIFFWQERKGRDGKPFFLHKFRSLRAPLDENGAILSDEERLSIIGHYIRIFRLDEIPQLLSVISGDMSLIGPRPLLPRDEPNNPGTRLLARPGITGWAQIHGNEQLTPEERNALDCWYILNADLTLDILILIKTIVVLLRGIKRDEETISQATQWFENFNHE